MTEPYRCKAVLFDNDNTLMRTEYLHCQSWIETLAEVDIILTPEEYRKHWVKRGLTLTEFLAGIGSKMNPDALRKIKMKKYHDMLSADVPLFDGTEEVLRQMSQRYKLALVTSSYRYDIDFIMELTDFGKYFETTVSCNEAGKPKPDPAGFLLAAQLLQVDARNCVVVEDAEKGIIAAKSAGMKAIAIPDEWTADDDFSRADLVLKNIRQLTPEIAESLFHP